MRYRICTVLTDTFRGSVSLTESENSFNNVIVGAYCLPSWKLTYNCTSAILKRALLS